MPESELKLVQSLNRTLAAVSEANRALIRSRNEEELIQAICGIVVDKTGYRLAWVGFAEKDKKRSVKPIASAGYDAGYLKNIKISWADNEFGQGPTGKAIRTGKSVAVTDISRQSGYAPWRRDEQNRGFQSSLALPLIDNGEVFGALNIYATKPDVFSDDEVSLLQGLADDLAYGIVAIRAQQNRDKAESELRAIFASAVDGIISADEAGIIDSINPAALQIFGYSREQIIGHSIGLFLSAEDRENHQQYLQRYLRTGEKHIIGQGSREVTGVKSDGTEFPVGISIGESVLEGKRRFIAVVRDKTVEKLAEGEKEQLQRQLLQAQKMEAIGHLTGGIAHDFNNILASILGYVGLALDRYVPDKRGKLAEYLYEISSAGERARNLVVQMLAFSRGGAAVTQRIGLQTVIKGVIKMLQSTLPSSMVINQYIEPGLPLIDSDPVQIQQVIMNLCINARDAMDGEGEMDVSLQKTELNGESCISCCAPLSGSFVELLIKDTGTGIEKHQLDYIFDPFYTTKEVGKGSGMGLAAVHGILHRYGGHILVESEIGKGTIFHILFPPSTGPESLTGSESLNGAEDHQTTAGVEKSIAGKNILVVDDEQAITGLLSEMLLNNGFNVAVTNDPREALYLFKADTHGIDLVITDQTMPKLTGIELTHEMLKLNPELPVILCTGFSENVNEDDAVAQGVKGYLTKPIDFDRMSKMISSLLTEKH